MSWDICLQIWLLKTLKFSKYDVFCYFFKKLKSFQKTIFFSKKFEVPYSLVGAVRVFSGFVILASKYECSNLVSFPNMTFFVIFFKKFSENSNLIFFKI